MAFRYFDSHCHLHFPAFDGDRGDVLARMKDGGVGAVVVGTDREKSRAALALAQEHDFFWAAVGLHPNDNPDEVFDEAAFAALADHPKVVAIGECGLDYFRGAENPEARVAQQERFRAHMELARRFNKPLIIHCRSSAGTQDAHDDLLRILEDVSEHERPRFVMHFFTASQQIAERALALCGYISFPCVVTFTSQYDEVVRMIPADRLLVETDAPYAAPKSHRGGRNEPAFVAEAVARMAEIRGVPESEMAAQIAENTARVLRIAIA